VASGGALNLAVQVVEFRFHLARRENVEFIAIVVHLTLLLAALVALTGAGGFTEEQRGGFVPAECYLVPRIDRVKRGVGADALLTQHDACGRLQARPRSGSGRPGTSW